MKIAVAIGFVALLGVGFYVADQYRSANTPEALHAEWKRGATESETAVRPASYEAMKWSPSDANEVEVRAPASVKPSKSQKK